MHHRQTGAGQSVARRLGSVSLRYAGWVHAPGGGTTPMSRGPTMSPVRPLLHVIGQPAERAASTASDRDRARRRRLEAVLLLAREPLSLRRLAQLATLEDATEARTLLRELAGVYDRRGAAFGVEAVAGGYQLLTRAKLAPWLSAAQGAARDPTAARLSPPARETLAVIAYRQPVVRAEIEAIRGVHCGELLRQLMQRDLVRIVGRGEELGRPLLYGTTKRFLQCHGLGGLEDLPDADRLRREATP